MTLPASSHRSGIPRYGTALLKALQLKNASCQELENLSHSEWQSLLALSDRAQLTLLIGHCCHPILPDDIRARIEKNSLDNADRFQRIQRALIEIADCFTSRSIDFCLLKGFTHSPDFTPDPLLRGQGDIDLWCLPGQIDSAYQILLELGYRPAGKSKGRHLDPMIRPTQWQWRGDYFARDLPMPVDLHFTLWDEKLELIPGPDEQAWWDRRVSLPVDGRLVPQLDLADTLTFAALHLMMHLLHGDLRLQRAWEIAHFLDVRAGDCQFWSRWQSLYSPRMLQLQVIAFDMARQWFGCALSPLVESHIEALPEDVSLWLTRYSFSPVRGLFIPNKDELWLNLCLLESFSAKARVLARRLLPMPHMISGAAASSGGRTRAMRARFFLRRFQHHLRTFHSACLRGVEWHWARWRPGRGFLIYLIVSVLFDFGESVFFLLYNLYLVERGFDEKFIGHVAAALTAGSFTGVLPASEITRRIGVRNVVMLAVLGTAAAAILRSLVSSQPALIGSAFMNGFFLSFWAVSLPPAVANLTSDRQRTFGFSLIASVGIGIGAVAGLIGGHLPAALLHLNLSSTSIRAKQMSLLAGSAVAALALLPAALLKVSASPKTQRQTKNYPNSPFIWAFLAALFVWILGTGGFNPFFNVYFSKHFHATVEQIGVVYSYSHVAQVTGVLIAPALLRRTGDVKGIALTQFATALALGLLALATNRVLGSVLFIAYMSFQYMTEPCLLSMLMTRVNKSEQSGASALNFLITALAGILASAIAGRSITHGGYGLTMFACTSVIAVAAVMFRLLVSR